jgi:hypothetical protein
LDSIQKSHVNNFTIKSNTKPTNISSSTAQTNIVSPTVPVVPIVQKTTEFVSKRPHEIWREKKPTIPKQYQKVPDPIKKAPEPTKKEPEQITGLFNLPKTMYKGSHWGKMSQLEQEQEIINTINGYTHELQRLGQNMFDLSSYLSLEQRIREYINIIKGKSLADDFKNQQIKLLEDLKKQIETNSQGRFKLMNQKGGIINKLKKINEDLNKDNTIMKNKMAVHTNTNIKYEVQKGGSTNTTFEEEYNTYKKLINSNIKLRQYIETNNV